MSNYVLTRVKSPHRKNPWKETTVIKTNNTKIKRPPHQLDHFENYPKCSVLATPGLWWEKINTSDHLHLTDSPHEHRKQLYSSGSSVS